MTSTDETCTFRAYTGRYHDPDSGDFQKLGDAVCVRLPLQDTLDDDYRQTPDGATEHHVISTPISSSNNVIFSSIAIIQLSLEFNTFLVVRFIILKLPVDPPKSSP